MTGEEVAEGLAEWDGRRARRTRNRDAVLDSVHALFVASGRIPTVEAVAEHSGVSLRSIYRYFTDTGELLEAALDRRIATAEPLWHLPALGAGPFCERVEGHVGHRLDVYELAGPTIRAGLAIAPEAPAIAERIEQRRAMLRAQTATHFAVELAERSPADAEARVDAVELLGQFEALTHLLVERRLGRVRAADLLTGAISAVLTSAKPLATP